MFGSFSTTISLVIDSNSKENARCQLQIALNIFGCLANTSTKIEYYLMHLDAKQQKYDRWIPFSWHQTSINLHKHLNISFDERGMGKWNRSNHQRIPCSTFVIYFSLNQYATESLFSNVIELMFVHFVLDTHVNDSILCTKR